MTLFEKLDHGSSITEQQINNSILAVIEDKEPEAVLLNTKQLYDKGKDSKGEKLKKYSPVTVAIKKKQNKPYDRTTLYDKGNFYAGWYIVAQGEFPVLFGSADSKTFDLVKKYGKYIFGLDRESQRVFNQLHLKKGIQNSIRDLFHL